MFPTLDAALLEHWAGTAVAELERHRAVIDEINVFPVADRDTGTNLLLTMRAAAAEPHPGGSVVAVADALARGALLGARGNSGVILSQVLRGLAEAVAAVDGPCAGAVLADALTRGARLAEKAVTRPQEGTVLTVLAAAADGAVATGSDRLDLVAAAAAGAAGTALRATPHQLPELARAGVVDAGGMGLVVVLDALVSLLPDIGDVVRKETAVVGGLAATGGTAARGPLATDLPAASDCGYEVMYLLDGCDDARADTLRVALDGLGDAAAVVGDGAPGGTGTWTVHVHCADIGAALEAGMAAGRPHGVRVMPLVDRGREVFPRARAVLAVVFGPQVAALAREVGADVLVRDCPLPGDLPADVDEARLVGALAGTAARHVALVTGDGALAFAAERAAAAARRAGQEVVVVPTASVVAGLAALAVHDPGRHAADDVVAMTEAAAGTRSGVLRIADAAALTWAGPCVPGDVLGLVDGEVVLIAPDLPVGALWLASRMLTAGGELVTVLLGDGVDDALAEGLVAELRRSHPEVDVVVHRGARPGHPVELGVE
ncbi:DAK2 domain-containing protein [Pseudonocardia charpentierae]|uniref:DAK2 domain-containing protein n=1 Tax=Pseudonocardia charpentierae TaxID=3075545 RepID=A0ABU2NAE7_9PSEU|nr:DAK2 domain-containing protein [Pseudonocardia sp. DSM 45834]MDT0350928.1 DAK2 domain-containing protein [Pseudonocardia sp. DSM 45834]